MTASPEATPAGAAAGIGPETTPPAGPRWLAEADVTALVDLTAAIAAVEAALTAQASGAGQTMEKTHVSWAGGDTLHALGGELTASGLVGTKTWAHTAGGAAPLLALWDASSGELRAVVEAFALGQLRTAAVSAVATRWLADPHADTLAMVGTGKQALAQVAAVAAVRPLAMVRVHSPTPEHRAAFVEVVRAELGITVEEAGSVAEASDGAGIVTTATRARAPFLDAGMVDPDTHVNAIGAITPERREITDDLVARAGLVAADSSEAARDLSAELAAAPEVTALSAVVAGDARRPEGGSSVFKAMGIGLADVAVGAAVLEAAERGSIGRPLPRRGRSAPQLRGGDHGRAVVP